LEKYLEDGSMPDRKNNVTNTVTNQIPVPETNTDEGTSVEKCSECNRPVTDPCIKCITREKVNSLALLKFTKHK
jgi:hypothetical protein